jgi:hypothetical protein
MEEALALSDFFRRKDWPLYIEKVEIKRSGCTFPWMRFGAI